MPLTNRPWKDILVAGGFVLVCCLLVFAAFWAYHQFITTPPYVDPDRFPVRGIDISAHNGDINFKKVRESGIEFVFIKATEGGDFKDRNFRTNYQKAGEAGIKRGIYHFFRFDKDGVEQAINFLKAVGHRRPEMGLVIDVEKAGNPAVPSHLINQRLTEMVEYLNLLGYRVMFYTNRSGYYDFLAESFPGYPLWICGFSQNPIYAEWSFWQYDHHGHVPGIKGEVDLDTFCGNRKEWARYLNGDLWPYSGSDNNNL